MHPGCGCECGGEVALAWEASFHAPGRIYLFSALASRQLKLLNPGNGRAMQFEELAARSVASIEASNPELASKGDAPPDLAPAGPPPRGCTLMGSGLNWSVYHGNVLSGVYCCTT